MLGIVGCFWQMVKQPLQFLLRLVSYYAHRYNAMRLKFIGLNQC